MHYKEFISQVDDLLERWAGLVTRRPWLTILALSCATAAALSGLPRLHVDSSPESFLHRRDQARVQYNEFRNHFGQDDLITLRIESNEIFSEPFLRRLEQFHRELERRVPHVADITSLVNARSTRGEDSRLVVEDLLSEIPASPEALALFRERVLSNPIYLDGLISRDGRVTVLLIEPSLHSAQADESPVTGFEEPETAATDERGNLEYLSDAESLEQVTAVEDVVTEFDSDGFDVELGGGPPLNVAVNSRIASDVGRFLLASALFNVAILAVVFRRPSGVLLPLIVVLTSLLSTLGIMALLGVPGSVPLQILPILLLAVGICSAIHLLTIFYQRLRVGDPREVAIRVAFRHSGLAIILAGLTTGGSLVSFLGSDVAPISHLGFLAPLGIALVLLYTLTLLPALLVITPFGPPGDRGEAMASRLGLALARCGRFGVNHHRAVLGFGAVFVGLASLGLANLHFSQLPMRWLPEDDPTRRAIERIDEDLAGVASIELVVDTGRTNGLHEPAMLRKLERVSERALNLPGNVAIGKATSIIDVVKETNRALHDDRAEAYRIPDDRELVAQELLLFESSGSDDVEDLADSRLRIARVSFRVPMVDYLLLPDFLRSLRTEVAEILGPEVSFHLTGLYPLFAETFEALIRSMTRSYAIAFSIVAPLMMLLLGGIGRGLLAMIPNLVPVILSLALMGWVGIPIDMSTLMVGTVVLGLAVDDTIHFMHRARGYLAEGATVEEAVSRTLESTGVALLVTSIVLCSGFLVLTLGYMRNSFEFGLLAAFATVVAFASDILLGPALLRRFEGWLRDSAVAGVPATAQPDLKPTARS